MTGDYELKKAGGSEELDQMDPKDSFLMNFRLYETQSRFYMVGRNKSKTIWRIMKIDRSEPTELNIVEDATTYSEAECFDLLTRLREGNVRNGGLKLVTTCYGIIGFIKFLGPYYMLIITKRKQIGVIDGHVIYAISKSEMIPIPFPSVQTDKNENRYKRLLCSIDLTKDFFFSYSYHVMRSLQNNLCDAQTGPDLYRKMFVWNEFLTRGIRHTLKNTLWTVALVYGFFKQEKLSVSGRDFYLTLISRRSRYFAGTRYRKRGVDEKGRVANDVETEQIVFEDLGEGYPTEISSVVQHRGSIPLFWSQKASLLNVKPKIVLSRRDENYKATRLHFDDLVTRYGKPVIILNLIKAREQPRESMLRGMFSYATEVINKDLSFENRLRFFHLDLHKLSKSKGPNVLESLSGVTEYSLRTTGFFHSQLQPNLVPDENNENHSSKQPKLQKGVLRTNCIDCLDRTNVAQYSYGLAALGYQLNALGLINKPKIRQDDLLAGDLMGLYEMMGDILALQYGGSLAHSKIFWVKRGHGKAAVQTQGIFRSVHRYLSNTYTDGGKQDAINIFLGYFQPRQGRPALWDLDADQHFNVGMRNDSFADIESARLSIKRSASDGDLVSANDNPMPTIVEQRYEGESSRLFDDSTPECSTSRFVPSETTKQLYTDMQSNRIHFYESKDSHNCYDFGTTVSENSFAGDLHEDYTHNLFDQSDWPDFASDRPDGYCSSAETWCPGDPLERYDDSDMDVLRGETASVPGENDSTIQRMTTLLGLSYAYWYWVTYGDTLDMPRRKNEVS